MAEASSISPLLLNPSLETIEATEAPVQGETAYLTDLAGRVATFVSAAKAVSTVRAYGCDWEDFTSWCSIHHRPAMPASPDTVALYITDLAASRATATIMRRLTSIAKIHEMAGHPSPATMRHAIVSETLKGIRRTNGVAQKGKLPLLTADLQKLLAHLPGNLRGVRDRALLLVGFAGAFRRSELAGFDFEQVEFNSDGLVLFLGKSKTDQEGKGASVAIPFGSHQPTCPVRALRKWLEASKISEGPLFRGVNRHGTVSDEGLHPNSIAGIVKRTCTAAGYNPVQFAGHSLRAGLATQAAANGVSERLIMRQTRHRSVTTLRRYIREGSLFRENVAAKVGL